MLCQTARTPFCLGPRKLCVVPFSTALVSGAGVYPRVLFDIRKCSGHGVLCACFQSNAVGWLPPNMRRGQNQGCYERSHEDRSPFLISNSRHSFWTKTTKSSQNSHKKMVDRVLRWQSSRDSRKACDHPDTMSPRSATDCRMQPDTISSNPGIYQRTSRLLIVPCGCRSPHHFVDFVHLVPATDWPLHGWDLHVCIEHASVCVCTG